MTNPPIGLMSKVPPAREITAELVIEELAPIWSTPLEMVVLPLKVLLPFKVTVFGVELDYGTVPKNRIGDQQIVR